jgi:hypothetical protein
MKQFVDKYVGEILITLMVLVFVVITAMTYFTDKPTYIVPYPKSTSDTTKTEEFDIYPWIWML